MKVFVTGASGFIGSVFLIGLATLLKISGASAEKGVPESERYVRRLTATHLDRPEAVVPMAGNTVLVAERSGRILLIDGAERSDLGTISVPGMQIFYVPERPYTEGLKDLISVPGQPGVYLWGMTTGTAQARRWTIGRARIRMDHGKLSMMKNEILWQSELQPWIRGKVPPYSGCRMVLEGDDVIVAMGANSRATGSGRVMRLSMSGSHPPQVISTGHRNPSGVLFEAGTLWEVEHGPKGGDELNILVQGGDYGWPAVSQGEPDDEYHPTGFLKSRPGSIDPVVTWTPAIAPSSLTYWRGKFYVGALKGERVIELTVSGKNIVSQRRFLDFGKRIRDVRAGYDDKSLWVLTDGPDAELFQVTPDQSRPE